MIINNYSQITNNQISIYSLDEDQSTNISIINNSESFFVFLYTNFLSLVSNKNPYNLTTALQALSVGLLLQVAN
jgi:hypothetical protein